MCIYPSFLSQAFHMTSYFQSCVFYLLIGMYTYGCIHVMGGQRAAEGLVLSHLVPRSSVLRLLLSQLSGPAFIPLFLA